jgi:hypothetical protein
MANSVDIISKAWQQVVGFYTPAAQKAQSTVQSMDPGAKTGFNDGYSPSNDPLFHHSDNPSVTGPAMQLLQNKKFHERVIGEKWNLNSEQNHIDQQRQLNATGLSLIRAMYSRQYNGEKPNW